MKRIDDTILEAIAELICGSGGGSGGGYETAGPYRTKGEIVKFFHRTGTNPKGQSSTRKWFVLESLQQINGKRELEEVILRLASPKEYRGDATVTKSVVEQLNQLLQIEGLEIVFSGADPRIAERRASATAPKPKETPMEVPPDFLRLVQDSSLSDVLSSRWKEAQKCSRAGAYLAAVVMMGSILEGVLLHKVETHPERANRANSSPKHRGTGKPKPIHEWGLSALIDVAHELGWLQGDVKRFSHALRESRNLVHPYMERLQRDKPDRDTCSICWQVVRAAVADLLGVD